MEIKMIEEIIKTDAPDADSGSGSGQNKNDGNRNRRHRNGDRRRSGRNNSRRGAPKGERKEFSENIEAIADFQKDTAATASHAQFDFGGFGMSEKEDDSYLDSMPPDPTLDAVFADAVPAEDETEPEDGVEIVGIKFSGGGKIYYFAPNDITFKLGEHAIVETARGMEFGDVAIKNRKVEQSKIVQPLRAVLRRATDEDMAHNEENHRKEEDALKVCSQKVDAHKLDMKLVGAQYTFDNTKLIFYFTSAGRVDFRDLVKDLASVFRTRIELRQIGIRDEARMLGGLGVCGRKLCCSNFLPNFAQVSIRMAKEKGLSLNSAKISGNCGRLMCCLRFEQDSYEREIALMPPQGSVVKTADGNGVVTDIQPISSTVRVKLDDKPEQAPKAYKLKDIKVIKLAQRVKSSGDASEDEEQE
jgi:cell fate regulator YaaT (PSP1 superfamily)